MRLPVRGEIRVLLRVRGASCEELGSEGASRVQRSSGRLRDPAKYRCDRGGQAIPGGQFRFSLLLALREEPVKFCAPVIFRHPPFRSDPPLIFKTIKYRIKRILPDLQDVL